MILSVSRMWLTLVVAGAALALAAAGDTSPALRCPPDAAEDRCLQQSSSEFKVEGGKLRVVYNGDNSLRLKCSQSLQLDSVQEVLPRFTPALRIETVTLTTCRPSHYAAVFAALNVTLTSPLNLTLYGTRKALTAAHFADLPPLRHLTLRHASVLHSLPASLEALTTLTVEEMKLSDDILEALPRTLTELRLDGVNITRVPAAVLELPELRSLHVANIKPRTAVTVERGSASQLRQLYVASPDAALLSEWAPPALEEVTLEYWRAEWLNQLPACDKLVKLILLTPEVRQFPAGWVARCPRLEKLQIVGAFKVTKLPATLFENATQLTKLAIHSTEITSLPTQLFADTPHLTYLDLNYNHLKELPPQLFSNIPHLTYLNLRLNDLTELPPQLFANTPHLTALDLSHNRFKQLPSALSLNLGDNSLNASAAAELATFNELRNLSLSSNWKLGDLCAVNGDNIPGKSPLSSLTKLERLDLSFTGISVICSDWREDLVNLKYLDLGGTKMARLTYEELQYKRTVPAVVELAGTFNFTADDYDRAAEAAALAPPSRDVTIILNIKTEQKCSLYWVKNALDDGLLPLDDVVIAYFINKLSLKTIRSDALLCLGPDTCDMVPHSCYCGMAGGGLLRVLCDSGSLHRVPRLPSLDKDTDVQAVDLVLSDNSITELGVDDLPSHLRVLDLRNNSISYMTEATARALVSGTKRRVLLAGNQLDCSCRATPALRVLRDHATVLVGYAALRCEDGGTLQDAVDACSTSALR